MVELIEDTTCVPTELYPYIYQFLVENDLKKSAKKFKKEARFDTATPTGSNLLDIFAKHAAAENKPSEKEVEVPTAENNEKKSKKKRKLEDSIGDNVVESEDLPKPKKKKEEKSEVTVESVAETDEPKKKKKKKKKNSDTSLNDTVEEESEKMETEVVTEEIETEKKSKKKKKNKSVDSSEVQDEKTDEKDNTLNETVEDDKNATDESSEDTAVVAEESAAKVTSKLKRNESFRRVVEESVFVRTELADNSFDAKHGSRGDWGEKANQDLRCTKGKSFRHEKTKKKRGSYRGGNINTSVNSIKFDDSDEE